MVYTIFTVGDIMLDKYYRGSVSRISPEAPVPVVKVNDEHITLGGAGNVANNLASLEVNCHLFGLLGDDSHAKDFQKLAKQKKISLSTIVSDAPTITKIRVLGEHQQITRLDFEQTQPLTSTLSKDLQKHLVSSKDVPNAIILSDYAKGVCTAELCQAIITYAHDCSIPVLVDPKGTDWGKYSGATFITPNLKEVEQLLNRPIQNTDEAVVAAGKEILANFKFEYLLITRSEKGMTLLSKDSETHYSAQAKEVFDVSGAGDTVIATLAWSLVQGTAPTEAAYIANIAAGVVVGKLGTSPIELDELLTAIDPAEGKVVSIDKLTKHLKLAKKLGKHVVFTNGCFDILHKGHIDYLKKAKQLGDILIVGVNSDRSVQKLKGPNRPINQEADRLYMLSQYEFIDFLILFSEETPYSLLKQIRPSILTKGGDYSPDEVIGKEFADQVIILPFVDGYSTTGILNKQTR